MMNQLVVLVNLIGLFIIDTFFLADISITQNIPASMQPGSEVRVTVTVNKADLAGFAKLQLDLPEGLSATAIDTKGASFTFADGKAKFIWMALPTTPTFKITYTLSASASAQARAGKYCASITEVRSTTCQRSLTAHPPTAAAVPRTYTRTPPPALLDDSGIVVSSGK